MSSARNRRGNSSATATTKDPPPPATKKRKSDKEPAGPRPTRLARRKTPEAEAEEKADKEKAAYKEVLNQTTVKALIDGPVPPVAGLEGKSAKDICIGAYKSVFGRLVEGMDLCYGGDFKTLNERLDKYEQDLKNCVNTQSLKTQLEAACNNALMAFQQSFQGAQMADAAKAVGAVGGTASVHSPPQAGAGGAQMAKVTPAQEPTQHREFAQLKAETLDRNKRYVEETVSNKMYKEGVRYLDSNGTPREEKTTERWMRYICDNDLQLRSERECSVAKVWITKVVEDRLVKQLRNPIDEHRKGLTKEGTSSVTRWMKRNEFFYNMLLSWLQ